MEKVLAKNLPTGKLFYHIEALTTESGCDDVETMENMTALDKNGTEIIVGDKVIWIDPAIEARDLERVWVVDRITEEIVFISDNFSEAEVFANELLKKN